MFITILGTTRENVSDSNVISEKNLFSHVLPVYSSNLIGSKIKSGSSRKLLFIISNFKRYFIYNIYIFLGHSFFLPIRILFVSCKSLSEVLNINCKLIVNQILKEKH